MNRLTEQSRPGTSLVRTPISAPLVRTRSGDGDLGAASDRRYFGDGRAARVIAVIAHAGADEEFGLVERPNTMVNFGLPIAACVFPEFAG